MSKKVLVIFGTRPEAIKLAPVLLALNDDSRFDAYSCSTGQHRDMVAPVSEFFGLVPDFDLNIMKPGQTIDHVTTAILKKLPTVFAELKPDLVIVQGDTASAFAAALSAFFCKIEIGHVEAGLRTFDLRSPWPEEGFRNLVGRLANFHFAPTERAHRNLVHEAAQGDLLITGNTVVDAARIAAQKLQGIRTQQIALRLGVSSTDRKKILFTMHRRESFGEPVERVFRAMRDIAGREDVDILFPVHPNPNIFEPAHRILGATPNIRLLEPLSYDEMIFALQACSILITDSGGLAEEAPTFRKPALILRDATERPECVECGNAMLVGQDTEKLRCAVEALLAGGSIFERMAGAPNPFGDGHAAERIVNHLAGTAALLAAAA
jgi:UDP-N-acetylglucosamine 2-epimerase (non-hydrolysing)